MPPVAITAMAADSFLPRERGQAMSLYPLSNGVGQMIGHYLLDLLLMPLILIHISFSVEYLLA